MQEEILSAIRNKYNEKINEQIKYKRLQERLVKLQEEGLSQKYLSLSKNLENVKLEEILQMTRMDIINLAFLEYQARIDETNGIYVYLGTFIANYAWGMQHDAIDYEVDRNNPRAEYRIYHDLEKKTVTQVPIELCDKFEQTHKILFSSMGRADRYYQQIQQEFIEDCVCVGQQEAVFKVLKKSK